MPDRWAALRISLEAIRGAIVYVQGLVPPDGPVYPLRLDGVTILLRPGEVPDVEIDLRVGTRRPFWLPNTGIDAAGNHGILIDPPATAEIDDSGLLRLDPPEDGVVPAGYSIVPSGYLAPSGGGVGDATFFVVLKPPGRDIVRIGITAHVLPGPAVTVDPAGMFGPEEVDPRFTPVIVPAALPGEPGGPPVTPDEAAPTPPTG